MSKGVRFSKPQLNASRGLAQALDACAGADLVAVVFRGRFYLVPEESVEGLPTHAPQVGDTAGEDDFFETLHALGGREVITDLQFVEIPEG